MKRIRNRLLAVAMCAALPIATIGLNGTILGLTPDNLTVHAENNLFSDNTHRNSVVTGSVTSDPYNSLNGGGSSKWSEVYTSPEIFGGNASGSFIQDFGETFDETETSQKFLNPDKACVMTGVNIGDGKKNVVAAMRDFVFDGTHTICLSLHNPTNGGIYSRQNLNLADEWKYYLLEDADVEYLGSSHVNHVNAGQYLAIAAGDFNGSGRDTIIAYTGDYTNPAVKEYDYYEATMNAGGTVKGYRVATGNNIISNIYDEFGLTYIDNSKADNRCRNVPIVDIVTGDIDRDGRDELIVTAGLGSTSKDTTSVSKMKIYDYVNGAFTCTYTTELKGDYTAGHGRLVWASSAIGNVTISQQASAGNLDYPEIVTAGWLNNSADNDDDLNLIAAYGVHVTQLTGIKKSGDTYVGEYTESIYGTKHDTSAEGISPSMKNGLHADDGIFHADWDKRDKLGVGVVRQKGMGANGCIVLGDRAYTLNEGQHSGLYAVTENINEESYSVRKVLTGYYESLTDKNSNVSGEGFYLQVIDDDGDYHIHYYNYSGNSNQWGQYLPDVDAKIKGCEQAITVCNVDIDNDGMILKLSSVEKMWFDPKPIYVLEAPPYFKEIANSSKGETVIGTESTSGSTVNESVGISAEFEFCVSQELDFFVKLAEVEVGYALKAGISYEASQEFEKTLSLNYTNNSGENQVLVARTPAYIYTYQVLGNPGKDFKVQSSGDPELAMISVDDYNQMETQYCNQKHLTPTLIDDTFELGQAGNPYSYRLGFPSGAKTSDKTTVTGNVSNNTTAYYSGGSTTKTFTEKTTTANGFNVELGYSQFESLGVAGVTGKITTSVDTSAGYSVFHSEAFSRSGCAGNQYSDSRYDFNWDVGYWMHNGVPVVGYKVTDVEAPAVIPQNAKISNITNYSALLTWEVPYSKCYIGRNSRLMPDKIRIYRKLNENEYNENNYIEVNAQDLCYQFTDLDRNTAYTYKLVGYYDNKSQQALEYSEEVHFTTSNDRAVVNVTHGKGVHLKDDTVSEHQATNEAIDTIEYVIDEGYELPDGFYITNQNGIQISTSLDERIISISGTPKKNMDIEIPDMAISQYSVTFDCQGGNLKCTPVTSYSYFDDTIPLLEPLRSGYKFTGWTDEHGNTNVTEIPAHSTGNRTFTANWVESTDTPYVVEYYLRGVDGAFPDEPYYNEVFYGTTGDTVYVRPRVITGFTTPLKKDIIISADGDAVARFEYEREKYTLTLYDRNNAVVNGTPGIYYYEKVISNITAIPDEGYVFKGWSYSYENKLEDIFSEENPLEITMPAENISLYPVTEKITLVPYLAPTCTEIGHIEYYEGDKGNFYTDTAGTLLTDLNCDGVVDVTDTYLEILPHPYTADDINWVWTSLGKSYYDSTPEYAVTAEFTCPVCKHTETVDANYVGCHVTKPTLEADGKYEYYTSVMMYDTVYEAEKTDEIVREGHFLVTGGDLNDDYGIVFDTFEEAFEHYLSGYTLTLYADVNTPDTYYDGGYRNFDIDLNGHSIVAGTFELSKDFLLKNGTMNAYISNYNYGSDYKLKLDNVILHSNRTTEWYNEYEGITEVSKSGMQWMANKIEVVNNSELYIDGDFNLAGYSYQDSFDFTIDSTSKAVLSDSKIFCYNPFIVEYQIEQYLPSAYHLEALDSGNENYGIFNSDGERVTDPVELTLQRSKPAVTYQKYEAKDPTYRSDGNSEYYLGSDGKFYQQVCGEYIRIERDSWAFPRYEMNPSMNISADSSKLDINVYIPLAETYQMSDYTVTFGGKEQAMTETIISGIRYGVFSANCPAKEMSIENAIVINDAKDDSVEIYNHATSVKKYIDSILENENYADFASVGKSMLRYGAAAQTYFDYHTDSLANADIEGYGLDTLAGITIEGNVPTAEQLKEAIQLNYSEYHAMNMIFTADTSMLIAFRLNSDATAADAINELKTTLTNNDYDISYTPDASGECIIVKVKNIPIKKLGDTIFTIGDIEIKATDYLLKVVNSESTSENMKTLCKALYAYYQDVITQFAEANDESKEDISE